MDLPVRIPTRSSKPRRIGRTHVLDKGEGVAALDDHLSTIAGYVDLAKLGWGTSVVTPNLTEKLAVYARSDIEVCFGGTLLELAYLQDRLDACADWMSELGVGSVEVSDGVVEFTGDDKLRIVEKLSGRFTVYSEVGSKDADAIVSPARWVQSIRSELDAGASYVVLEGRESGTAGLYRNTGEIRMGLVEEIIESGIPVDRLVFEAPNKSQQVWLIQYHGPDVSLGNIPIEEVLAVETLRLGLRADTLDYIHGVRGGSV